MRIPERVIAGQQVQAIIHQVLEPWSIDSYVESYYVLENGALVATNTTVGEGVEISFGVIIEKKCVIGDRVKIDCLVRIGDETEVGADTIIGSRSVIEHESRIGEQCEIGYSCYIGAMNPLPNGTKLGSYTLVPHETLLEGDEFDATEGSLVITESRRKIHVIQRPEYDNPESSDGKP